MADVRHARSVRISHGIVAVSLLTLAFSGVVRSLHFLAAWWLVLPGAVYLLTGIVGGHFRSHIWPKKKELAPPLVWREVVDHVRFRIPPASGGPRPPTAICCAWATPSRMPPIARCCPGNRS